MCARLYRGLQKTSGFLALDYPKKCISLCRTLRLCCLDHDHLKPLRHSRELSGSHGRLFEVFYISHPDGSVDGRELCYMQASLYSDRVKTDLVSAVPSFANTTSATTTATPPITSFNPVLPSGIVIPPELIPFIRTDLPRLFEIFSTLASIYGQPKSNQNPGQVSTLSSEFQRIATRLLGVDADALVNYWNEPNPELQAYCIQQYILGAAELHLTNPSAFYTPKSPCCGGCTVFGGGVQVSYWPTPNPNPGLTKLVDPNTNLTL
jgi:hypothetical protein